MGTRLKSVKNDVFAGFYDDRQPPIVDDQGKRDHRGRMYPICGCKCDACFTAALSLIGGEKPEDKE